MHACKGVYDPMLGTDRQLVITHRLVIGARKHVAARVDKRAHWASVAGQRLQALHRAHIPHLHGPIVAAAEQPLVSDSQRANRVAVPCMGPFCSFR
jgi:hypothetical protein